MSSKEWVDRDAAVVWHGFTQMASFPDNAPIIVERAEGHYLIDVDGERYLDAISSLWVNTLGHRVPELDEALREQIDKVAHTTMLGNGNRVVVELAEALAPLVPVTGPHFLFASDGAAAVEQALKIAFQYWANRGVAGKDTYLTFGDAYHGDTIGSLSVGGDGFGSSLFDPLRFPVLRAPSYRDSQCLDTAAAMIRAEAGRLAAVVLEPLVQGAAGMLIADRDGYGALARACADTGVLLICDEVATGFGRTGTLFASEQCRLRPDILCLGKGLTAGYLPMAATAVTRRVYDEFLGDDLGPRTLYHGHSYSGNALAAAVALRHIDILVSQKIVEGVKTRSDLLRTLLDERVAPLPAVADVRLAGLMCGIELEPLSGTLPGRRVCAAAVERGVLLRPLGNVVVIMPPLTITSDEIEIVVATVAAAIEDVYGERGS